MGEGAQASVATIPGPVRPAALDPGTVIMAINTSSITTVLDLAITTNSLISNIPGTTRTRRPRHRSKLKARLLT
jgi:hypothetical protein